MHNFDLNLSELSAEQRFLRLADWSRRNPAASLDGIQNLQRFAATSPLTGDFQTIVDELALNSSGTARFLAAFIFEANRDFASAARVLDSFSCSPSRSAEAQRLLALARIRLADGQVEPSVIALKRAIRLAESHRALASASKLLRELVRSGSVRFSRTCRVAILGNATYDFFIPALKTVAFASGIDLVVHIGAYGQLMQEILDETSALHVFKPQIIVLATNYYWLGWAEETPDDQLALQQKIQEIEQIWNAITSRFGCHIIQHNFVAPETSALGALTESLPQARGNLIRRLNLALYERAQTKANVSILAIDQIAALVGIRKWNDSRMWIAAKQYPSADGMPLLAACQIAQLRSLLGLTSKCLVLDLDNVLWGGVIGEDGLGGIRLGGSAEGEAFVEFQRYVKSLRQRGVILAVCSKNNPDDARLPFASHPEMILKLEDISIFVANWEPKADTLRTIAEQLNIGLDALVFLDDSPFEREHVRRNLPEVQIPEIPEDPALYAETLHREFLFEALSITSEDLGRAESYRANREREVMRQSSSSLEEFLAGLQIRVELHPFDKPNLPRIAQLLNKTNQFNLTTLRMTPEQIQVFTDNASNYTQYMSFQDRFGISGITGLMMASPRGSTLEIVLWLISCRVLGRRVEDAMMASVWNFARSAGYSALLGSYIPTAKNRQVSDLYDRMGFALVEERADGTRHYRAELLEGRTTPDFITVADLTGVACAAS